MAKPIALDPKTLQPAPGALGPDAIKLTVHDLNWPNGWRCSRATPASRLTAERWPPTSNSAKVPGAPGESAVLAGTVTMADLHGAQRRCRLRTAEHRASGSTPRWVSPRSICSLGDCLATLTSADKALGSVGAKARWISPR